MLFKQARFNGFVARVKLVAEQARPVKQVHLPHTRNVHQGKQAFHFELGTGFFHRLARRAFSHRFVELHEARRQRPLAPARLDVALA